MTTAHRAIRGAIAVFSALCLFAGYGATARAAAPGVLVNLHFEKKSFAAEEKVTATLALSNTSGREILISRGFGKSSPYRALKVIDPAGNLLRMRAQKERHTEVPNTPPLPLVLVDGKLIEKAPCEILPASWKSSSAADLRNYFDFKLTGHYSIQAEISAMTFSGTQADRCDVRKYEWSGILASETQIIFIQAGPH